MTTPTIAFMSANFVARQLDFQMTEGWEQGDQATQVYFRPVTTFAERFDALLREVLALGFKALDLWTAHLHWSWATDEHLATAASLLRQHGLAVPSLAGNFGATPAELEAACRVAVAVGAPILGGSSALLLNNRSAAVRLLKHYGLRFGIENHPEKTPEEMLAQLGDDDTVGTAIDTGWYATQGYDAVRAIEALSDRIVYVHLKDVRAPSAHITCRFGEGVVPVKSCVNALRHVGYASGYSIEHEPEQFDPSADCRAMLAMLHTWLAYPAA